MLTDLNDQFCSKNVHQKAMENIKLSFGKSQRIILCIFFTVKNLKCHKHKSLLKKYNKMLGLKKKIIGPIKVSLS